ncbi:MAG: ATP-binding protein, partial [Thermoplasmata archaeon]
LDSQAEVLGYPLEIVYIPQKSGNEEYEQRMGEKLQKYKDQGVEEVVFGDIFLEDVREYREKNLARIGMRGIFPLWGRDTKELASNFVKLGFKAIVTCVDSKALDRSFVGRIIDEQFLSDLPEGVDHCGENGEFHSFVYDGPIFKKPISFERGEVVLREDRFWYIDLI